MRKGTSGRIIDPLADYLRELDSDREMPACDYKALRAENAKRQARAFRVEHSRDELDPLTSSSLGPGKP